jgi:hypothetical protein
MAPVFIVKWEGTPPADKAEWISVLREALAGELGSYRVIFKRGTSGWRFDIEWRPDSDPDEPVIANTPDSVAFNIYAMLAGSGKPIDPGWKPGSV